MFDLLSIFNFNAPRRQSQSFAMQLSSWQSLRCMRDGFLLIEVLVGLLLTMVLMTVFAFSCVQVWQHIAEGRERMEACVVGRSCLDYCLASRLMGEHRLQVDGYSALVRLSYDAQLKHLVRGTVTVAWKRGSLTLQTGECV